MQPPAECCPEGARLLLRRAIAAVCRPAHLATAPGARPLADGQRHAVNDEECTARERFTQEIKQDGELVCEAMQPSVEAGDRERAREIAEGAQHAQGAFLMILELAGGNDAHG